MEQAQTKTRRVRVHRTAEFKSRLIAQATQPGASMAGIAVAHGVNPNLLRRWIRESNNASANGGFIPVMLQNPTQTMQVLESRPQCIEVNINRRDLRIAFKLDALHIGQLGQVLHEVLR